MRRVCPWLGVKARSAMKTGINFWPECRRACQDNRSDRFEAFDSCLRDKQTQTGHGTLLTCFHLRTSSFSLVEDRNLLSTENRY